MGLISAFWLPRYGCVDRFLSQEDVVLIATDVAARGIDVKDVGAVIHYQLPKATDTCVGLVARLWSSV